MNGPPQYRYDITITNNEDSSLFPSPAAFTAGAQQHATARGANGLISAHTAEKIISIVTVTATSRPTAMAIRLAVVSNALRQSESVR